MIPRSDLLHILAYQSVQLRDRHGLFILPLLSPCGCLCAASERLRLGCCGGRQPDTVSRTTIGDNESWCSVQDLNMSHIRFFCGRIWEGRRHWRTACQALKRRYPGWRSNSLRHSRNSSKQVSFSPMIYVETHKADIM